MSLSTVDLDWPALDEARPGGEYARYAEIYDAVFGAMEHDARFYLECAKRCGGETTSILELGSGTGRVTEKLLAAGHRVVGVDASVEMLTRARRNLEAHGERYRGVHADVRAMSLGERFPLVIAPCGMVAHLLSDDDRRRAFRAVFEHLEPGGVFVLDDAPSWIAGAADGTQLELRRTGTDPSTGKTVRLLTTSVDVAHRPLTVRHDFIDWMDGTRVERRLVVRIVFRNVPFDAEVALLLEAGFSRVEASGGFDGRPFDAQAPARNDRLVLRCSRDA